MTAANRLKLTPILLATFLLLIAVLVWVMSVNGGKFVYTLDDPYIHLSLARRIAQGHYGINPGENSAPSSSIVWPFLLAPLAGTAVGEIWPLVICILSSLAAVAVAVRAFGQRWNPWLVACGAIVLTNQVGLVFTGMEHTLQVLIALLAAVGILEEMDTDRVSPWLIAALVAGPLVRYENLALTLPCCAYLFFRGHRRIALMSFLLPLLGLAAFSFFLKSLGLGLLPSSVVAKSGAGAAGNPVKDLFNNFKRNLTIRETLLECYSFLLILGVLVYAATKLKDRERLLALTAVLAGSMHMFLGRFGWAGRYEPYIVAFDGALLLGLWPSLLRTLRPPPGLPSWPAWLLAAGILPLSLYYVFLRGLRAPSESHDIFLQQYQMHRFVLDQWKQPVAVNDLGWVSWQNDTYVLDLWGLGSYEALKLRGTEPGTDWMARLCRDHSVKLAMVYDDWFHGAPAGWTKVAELSRFQGKPRPRDDVSFYATDLSSVDQIRQELVRFQPSLPDGATIKFK